MTCESCGSNNPATNRYCGQCGNRMEKGAGGELPFKHIDASADLPPEVIEFDNHIPIIANNGTDRRIHPPSDLVENIHDRLEHEAEMHDRLEHGSETHSEVHARQDVDRNRMRKSLDEYLLGGSDNKAVVNRGQERDLPQPVANQNFLPEGTRTSRTGVSGPSFLGLTDDSAPEYDDEEPQPKSHIGRNVALAVLAALLILVASQWRTIRNYGMAYVQNGSLQTKHSENEVAAPPSAVTSADPNLSSATTKTSPSERTPANGTLPVRAADSKEPAPDPATSPSTGSTQHPPAMSGPVADVPKEAPENAPEKIPEKESSPAASRTAVNPRSTRANESAGSVSPASVPGADEMHRAAHARGAEDRAAWLWKAVGKGNPQAPIELATMYELGNGVVQSCSQAEVLLRSAAAKGNEQAKIGLQRIRIRGGCSGR